MKYIDIHSHLNFSEYDLDRDEVIKRLQETETGTIVVGTDLESSRRAVDIANKYENIYACIGVHPVDDPSRFFEPDEFQDLINNPKVVAVGECGLDFFHADKGADFQRQKELFMNQINFALKFDKSLMIHSRDAYPDLIEMLMPLKAEYGDKLRGDIHFFAGDLEMAKKFWDIGFSTSFTGVITFARNYDDVIKNAPLNMIMSETDAPFVAPLPYRGKRNEPSYVNEVVKKIAEIRGEDLEEVSLALASNALRMFKLESGSNAKDENNQ